MKNKSITGKGASLISFEMKKLPERKKRVLCSNVEAALLLCKAIKNRYPQNSYANDAANDLQGYIAEIKEQALAMEKRLYLYKETIEGLGFKRVRK